MNILFIGPYRQYDEWGYKSRAVLKSLQKTSHNITSRPIFLSNNPSFDNYVENTEQTIFDNYDVIIQYVLEPHAMYFGGASKNIGIFNYETIPHSRSKDLLRSEILMDEIWTDSALIKDGLENIFQKNNIETKVVNVPPTLDLDSIPEQPTQALNREPELQNRFMFYYIGNPLDEKEGCREICTAYLNTFTSHDAVGFTIFTDSQLDQQEITNMLEECKKSIGNHASSYSQPLINVKMPQNNFWTGVDKINIHTYGDSLVSVSRSVCASSSVLEAAICQKSPIVNNQNAAYELLGEENLWGVDSYTDFCLYSNRPLPYRYTGGELWNKPNIESLGKVMKNCYINKLERDQKKLANQKLRKQFENISYEKILDKGSI